NDFAFPAAMAVGDELSVYGEIIRTGRTSMTVRATGIGRARASEERDEVARGEFIFVVVDEEDRPTPIAA
ncbi:MAG TPA: acyl-CoA thioesterase, partial [Novosphingobium sp.]|nr:acyl-CoA thioesterase [Novosphingobium sp.]